MRKAMIVWGGWPGHDPDLCASMIRGWLKAEGFEVRIETTTEAFLDPAHQGPVADHSDLHHVEDREAGSARRCATRSRAASASPDTMAAWATRSAKSVDYQFMCGGQWVAHPGNIIDYKVDVTKPDDPIMAGIESFEHRSEQYYMHIDPAIEVLATTTFNADHAPWIDGVVMPVVWKKRFGEGRVFYSLARTSGL